MQSFREFITEGATADSVLDQKGAKLVVGDKVEVGTWNVDRGESSFDNPLSGKIVGITNGKVQVYSDGTTEWTDTKTLRKMR